MHDHETARFDRIFDSRPMSRGDPGIDVGPTAKRLRAFISMLNVASRTPPGFRLWCVHERVIRQIDS